MGSQWAAGVAAVGQQWAHACRWSSSELQVEQRWDSSGLQVELKVEQRVGVAVSCRSSSVEAAVGHQ